MAAPKLSFALIFFAFFVIGHCQGGCELSDIKVAQYGTEVWVHGKPEYKVRVSNGCICSQCDFKLQCTSFQSLEGIDPAVFRQDRDACLLKDGLPLHGTITFNYAWDTKFNLVPLSYLSSCSYVAS